MATINTTDARLTTHEEVCAFRYEQINARLKRLESIKHILIIFSLKFPYPSIIIAFVLFSKQF